MKKMIVILTTLLSLIALPLMAYSEATVDSKAEALNKLTILQGDGINFNLTGQLKRSEAITFIVRIMGQEANVKANSSKYSETTFNDVKATDWFAAYVGFCKEQNILNGFPDGGFHPNESISEKAFLKLVLGALGYIYDKDFVWETIYESSFNLGLVSDVKYQTQDLDNTQYLRSDVVNVLYSSLKVNIKDIKKSIIQTLIEKSIVAQATAAQLGLVKEIIPTRIDKVEVVNQTKLNITLNKTVNPVLDKDILIYETENKSNILAATVTTQVYSNLNITTTTQIPNKSYTIEITSADESKNVSKATAIFKGHLVAEIKSDYFKISKVVTVSKNILNVYFTQPISNIESVLPVYYDIYKNNALYVKGSKNNMIVKVLSSDNNAVSIYLKDGLLTDDAPYMIKVSGDITSAYGVQLNDGAGDSSVFASQKSENSELKVNRIYPLNSKTLNIEFNQEIDALNAKQMNNYQIAHSNGTAFPIVKAAIPTAGMGKVIQLTILYPFDTEANYQVKFNAISDLFNNFTLQDVSNSFSGKPLTEPKALKINSIIASDKSTIVVSFDRKMDPVAALNSTYYSITGVTDSTFSTIPSKVYINPLDSSSITLYLPPGKELISPNNYRLKVLSVLPDELGTVSTIDTFSPVFTGSSNLNIKPFITEAILIGKDTVKIKISKELLDSGANLMVSNYSLELKDGKNTTILKTPISLIMYNETTLILHFDNLDLTKNYTFKFNSLTDYTGLNIRSVADGPTSILLKNGETTP